MGVVMEQRIGRGVRWQNTQWFTGVKKYVPSTTRTTADDECFLVASIREEWFSTRQAVDRCKSRQKVSLVYFGHYDLPSLVRRDMATQGHSRLPAVGRSVGSCY